MFFVYYGSVGPDNYDATEGPIYQIREFATEKEVLEFRKEFYEDYENYENDDYSNEIFRIFEGKERLVQPKEIIETFELK